MSELQARIDRTLDYTDSLLRLSNLSSDLIAVLQAVHNSLTTPIAPEPCELEDCPRYGIQGRTRYGKDHAVHQHP